MLGISKTDLKLLAWGFPPGVLASVVAYYLTLSGPALEVEHELVERGGQALILVRVINSGSTPLHAVSMNITLEKPANAVVTPSSLQGRFQMTANRFSLSATSDFTLQPSDKLEVSFTSALPNRVLNEQSLPSDVSATFVQSDKVSARTPRLSFLPKFGISTYLVALLIAVNLMVLGAFSYFLWKFSKRAKPQSNTGEVNAPTSEAKQ